MIKMTLSEADIERYARAIQWARIPSNKEHLSEELKLFMELIESKVTRLKEADNLQKTHAKFTYNLNDFALPFPTYTVGVPNEKV
jgi:hypothetical protein